MKLFINIVIAGCISFPGYAQLYIQNNATINTTGATVILLQDMDLVNNGTFSQQTGGGKVIFAGTSNNVISGTGGFVPVFDTLEMAKTGGAAVALGRTCNISSGLKFTSGNMNLNGWNLNFGSTGFLIGENENNHVIDLTASGNLIASGTLNAPNAANIANFGAIITSSANLGQTTVLRKAASTLTNNGSSVSTIKRQYLIVPANNTSLNATLRLNYFDGELNSMDETNLQLFKSQSPYIVTTSEGFTTRDVTGNYVEKTGINDFSLWALGTVSAPLPLLLAGFHADCSNGRVILAWNTEQERNVAHFEIQRSEDALSWLYAGLVPFTENKHQYQYVDVQAKGFYRLAVMDRDGGKTYSDIVRADCNETAGEVQLWPNPARNQVTIAVTTTAPSGLMIRVYDSKGAVVLQQTKKLNAGDNQVTLDMSELATGAYWFRMEWNNGAGLQSVKVVKL